MATATLIQRTTAIGTTSLAGAWTSAPTPGRLLLAIVTTQNAASSDATCTTPAGWTAIPAMSSTASASTWRVGVWYFSRTATDTESAPSFTLNSGSAGATLALEEWDGLTAPTSYFAPVVSQTNTTNLVAVPLTGRGFVHATLGGRSSSATVVWSNGPTADGARLGTSPTFASSGTQAALAAGSYRATAALTAVSLVVMVGGVFGFAEPQMSGVGASAFSAKATALDITHYGVARTLAGTAATASSAKALPSLTRAFSGRARAAASAASATLATRKMPTTGLPAKAVIGYWWLQNSTQPLSAVHPAYNVVVVSFAKGESTTSGRLHLMPPSEGVVQLHADVAAMRARGVKVLLGVGGSTSIEVNGVTSPGYHLSTAQQIGDATSSLSAIVADYGFDGIVWDIEAELGADVENSYNFSTVAVASVLNALCATHQDLIVMLAPEYFDTTRRGSQYRGLADLLGANLAAIAPQFYNHHVVESQSVSDMLTLSRTLIAAYGQERVVLGVMHHDDAHAATDDRDTDNTTNPASEIGVWQTLLAESPQLRGMALWNTYFDEHDATYGAWAFAVQVAPVIAPPVGIARQLGGRATQASAASGSMTITHYWRQRPYVITNWAELSQAERAALVNSPAKIVEPGCQLVDFATLEPVADISSQLDASSGDVAWDATATVHRDCSLTLALTSPLVWGVALARVYLTIVDTLGGVAGKCVLGTFCLTAPDLVLGEYISDPGSKLYGATAYQVSGQDRLYLLDRQLGYSYAVLAGTGVLAAVAQVFVDAGLAGVQIDPLRADAVIPTDMVWPLLSASDSSSEASTASTTPAGSIGDPALRDAATSSPSTWLAIVNDLLRLVNYRAVWCDETGAYRATPYVDPKTIAPNFTFDGSGAASNVALQRTVKRDPWGVPNQWTGIWSNMPDSVQPSFDNGGIYTVQNTDSGPSSIAARNGLLWPAQENYTAASAADLADQVDAKAAADQRGVTTFTVRTMPYPPAGHFDVFAYVDPAATGIGEPITVQATAWQIALNGDDTEWTWTAL